MRIRKIELYWPALVVVIPMLVGTAQQPQEASPAPYSKVSQPANAGTTGAGGGGVPHSTAAEGSAPTQNPIALVKITVGKETTYVLGPVDKDGNIDFVGALHERYSKGITSENNAAIPFWQGAGPWLIPIERREEFFGALGISAPPLLQQGDCFPGLEILALSLAKVHPEKDAGTIETEMRKELEGYAARVWSRSGLPKVAARIDGYAGPLAKFTEASKKPRFFSALLPVPADSGLTNARRPDCSLARDVATMLVARAMLSMGEGRLSDAGRDLLACHRLARLIGQGPFMLHILVGVAIEDKAWTGDVVLSQQPGLSAEQARKYLRVLQELGPCKGPVEAAEFGERLAVLDVACRVARTGPATCLHVQGLMDNISIERRKELAKMEESARDWDSPATVDWNEVLRLINARMDRMVAALKISDLRAAIRRLTIFGKRWLLPTTRMARKQRERMSSVLTGRIPSGTQPGLLADWLSSSLMQNLRTIDTIDRAEKTGQNY